MSDVDFAFISAKLHGLRAKMFDRENLVPLMNVRSLGDLAVHLGRDLTLEDHYELQRSVVEEHVRLLSSFGMLLDRGHAQFLRVLLGRYVLENLKVVIRCNLRPEYRDRLSKLLVGLPAEIDIDWENLIRAETVTSFVNSVPVHRWRDALVRALPVYEETGQSFVLEAALDCAYWRSVRDGCDLLTPAEAEVCRPALSLELDSTRLLITLRCVHNYRMPWAAIKQILPPAGELVLDEALEPIAEQGPQGEEEVVEPILRRLKIEREARDTKDLNALEFAIWERVYRVANGLFYRSSDNFGIVLGFFYLKRMELRNLICIIELIRYGAGPQEIGKRLVPPRAPV